MLSVVVGTQLEEAYLEQIAAVSPEIRLLVGRPRSEMQDSSLGKAIGRFRVEDLEAALPEAEVFSVFWPPADLRQKAKKLKWLHLWSAGVDHVAATGILDSPLIVTTSSGIHAVPIAEYVFGSMLMFSHRFHQAMRQQMAVEWKRYSQGELRDKTLGIVGYGHIGREIGRLARALGMRVVAISRSGVMHKGPGAEAGEPEDPALFWGQERLIDLLKVSDFVVLAVPLTGETEGLIGEAELRAMKPTAYLVNISRGKVVDESALIRALKEGWISGAGLDVFQVEPLPRESELWGLPNAILTPHIAGTSDPYDRRATELFCENLRRYLGGLPLLNVVDKARGY